MEPRITVEIELAEDAGPVAPPAGPSRPPALAAIGFAVVLVVAGLVLLGRTQTDGGLPDPATSTPPVERADPTSGSAIPASPPAATSTSSAGAVDPRWHRVWAAPAPAAADPVVLFTATPSSRRSAPPYVHVVADAATTTRALDGAMWLEEPSIEWPGEVLSPFVQTRSSIVYSSDGTVWSQDLGFERPHKPIAEGVRVLAGVAADDVWVFESGGAAVTHVDLARGSVVTHPPPAGFPLAAFGEGLVTRILDEGRRAYGAWTPGGGEVLIDVSPAAEFLGVGGGRAMFLDGAQLRSYDGSTGVVATATLDLDVEVRRAAVSPDGRFVAFASRPDIVSFSEVHVVEAKTGAVVDRFGPVMDLQLQFVDRTTMQFIAPGTDLPWQVTHRDVTLGTERAVAGAESPMLWFAEIGGP